MGTPEYYTFRKEDYETRNHGKKAPEYYEQYGHKYAKKFSDLKSQLSEKGQGWIDRTMMKLQEKLEEKLKESKQYGYDIENNPDQFKKTAYETHAPAYEEAGIANLEVDDIAKIATTPDIKDIATPDGAKQVVDVGTHVAKSKFTKFTNLVKTFLKQLKNESGE